MDDSSDATVICPYIKHKMEWDGRSESWENAAQEVGRQLEWRQLFSFHLTGYPGDLKFPGRSAQYLPIFLLVAARPAFVCSFVLLRQLRMEVPPPCCYLMTRGGVGEVNNPAGLEEWGGIEIFFFQQAGRDWKLSILQTAFNWLPGDSFSETNTGSW